MREKKKSHEIDTNARSSSVLTFNWLTLEERGSHGLNEAGQPTSFRIVNHVVHILQHHPPHQPWKGRLDRLQRLASSPTHIHNCYIRFPYIFFPKLLIKGIGPCASCRIANCCQWLHTAIENFRTFGILFQVFPETETGMVTKLERAVVVVGWVLILGGLKEMRHGVHSLAKEVVHLLEHVAVCGDDENGGKGILRVMWGGGLLEEMSARASSHDSN